MACVYVCGEAIIDFVPVTVDGSTMFQPLPGGSPFNITKAAAQAGTGASFLGALSTDIFGEQLLADLQAHGGDTSLTPRSADPSTLAFVDTSSGEPEYAFFDRQSASTNMAPTPEGITPTPGDILTIGSISLIPQPSANNIVGFAQTMSKQMMLAMDPNVRANMIIDRADWEARIEGLFDLCTLVKISSEDLAYLRPGMARADFAEELLGRGVALVVVTGGEDGALTMSKSVRFESKPPRVTLVDTVGAGDTFMGNLLAGLQRAGCTSGADISALDEAALVEILNVANLAAAINCTRKGCQPPKLDETLAALAEKTYG